MRRKHRTATVHWDTSRRARGRGCSRGSRYSPKDGRRKGGLRAKFASVYHMRWLRCYSNMIGQWICYPIRRLICVCCFMMVLHVGNSRVIAVIAGSWIRIEVCTKCTVLSIFGCFNCAKFLSEENEGGALHLEASFCTQCWSSEVAMGRKHGVHFVRTAMVFICMLAHSLATPLDDYVNKPDSYYKWQDTGKRIKGLIPLAKWEGVVLNMTSQGWLSSADVDCSIWIHYLVVVKPGCYEHKKTALLIIGGGTTGKVPSATDELLILGATLAVKTRSLVAVLYQVPNQPCHFVAEKPRRGRSEDDLIAYTWAHFLDHPDLNEWPLRLPMTKAAIRGMDTVQSYALEALNVSVRNFVVTGASKRGWTAWTTAAMDKRVVGVIPIVMDALNIVPNIHHSYRSLAGWSFAFAPYYKLNLTPRIDTPEFKELMDIVDPYQYKERLRVPKLIITTSNDEFFLIDDSLFFWDDLVGEKHMLVLSNTEHFLLTGIPKLLIAVEAFLLSIVEGHELDTGRDESRRETLSELQMPSESRLHERRYGRPKYRWYINRDAGTIDIGVAEKPLQVLLWYAYTTKGVETRDFRWFTLDLGNCPTVAIKGICIRPFLFHYRTLKPSQIDSESGMRNYFASIPFPQEGYGAFFVELRFAGPKVSMPFVFTTEAVVVPNTFPVQDCYGKQCRGSLV